MDQPSSASKTDSGSFRRGWSMQTKLVAIFLLVKVIPIVLLTLIAWHYLTLLGSALKDISVSDSTSSLNEIAIKNIERMTTDIAWEVAEFLYDRDGDLLQAAHLEPSEEQYGAFLRNARKRVLNPGRWDLAPDGASWVEVGQRSPDPPASSTNPENNDMDGFHVFQLEPADFFDLPLYDEITFVGPDGQELVKVVSPDSPKRRYPLSREKRDVSIKANTYVKSEAYFQKLKDLKPGEIYVSDVIGAYVGTNYIGMYTPGNVARASEERDYDINYDPEGKAFSGKENPAGRRFEGIIRWATPVLGKNGKIAGYVTLALNHDHLMEFVDHITTLDERYTKLSSAYEGNYAFIWDYQCRSICHPRHHSIVGYDPETGEPQIPWLESSIYEGWQKSGLAKWTDFVKDQPIFHEQSRTKRPAFALTKAGLVGLDGRYLNNAPQCTGWMDLTKNGGSGSFYILWSGLYKLTTAAAIPYYTGQYAPSEANAFSRRGFGIVTIGSGLDHFTRPVRDTEARLAASIESNLRGTMSQLIITTMALSVIVVLIAIWLARYISRPINVVSRQLSLLAIGEISSLPSDLPTLRRRDEIGMLAHSMQNLIESRREELDMVNAIAMGDYTRSIALRSEFDRLGKALNTMIRTNKNTLTQVNRAVEEVGDRAEAVSQVSASLSQDVETSEKAAASISETIDSVDRQAKDNAASAKNANHLAVAGCDAANRGYAAVTKLAGSMTEIRQSGNKIASVAKLIDDIAFQTNLLALNASVEAARAGRQGKGFSVVADEVRNLSARSAKAARETGVMVESMLKLMDEGTKLAERSDHEFREIVDTISQVAKLFASISDASNAQSSDMSQIVNGLNQISDVIQRNSNGAKQMAESANTLSRQAEDLRLMVSRFRLNTSNTSSNSRFLELSHPRNTP